MVSKRGWQLGFILALVSGLILSVLAVWQEAGRWQVVGEESLSGHYVGIVPPNGYCCKHAQYVGCTICVVNPQCPVNGTSQTQCNNSQNASAAECAKADNMFCSSPQSINRPGNQTGLKCTLSGKTRTCTAPPGAVQCSVSSSTKIMIPYTDCGNGNVSICTAQPDPACIIP